MAEAPTTPEGDLATGPSRTLASVLARRHPRGAHTYAVGAEVQAVYGPDADAQFPAKVVAVVRGKHLIEWFDGLEECRGLNASDISELRADVTASAAARATGVRNLRLGLCAPVRAATIAHLGYAPGGQFLSALLDKLCAYGHGTNHAEGLASGDAATIDDVCAAAYVLNQVSRLLHEVARHHVEYEMTFPLLIQEVGL